MISFEPTFSYILLCGSRFPNPKAGRSPGKCAPRCQLSEKVLVDLFHNMILGIWRLKYHETAIKYYLGVLCYGDGPQTCCEGPRGPMEGLRASGLNAMAVHG